MDSKFAKEFLSEVKSLLDIFDGKYSCSLRVTDEGIFVVRVISSRNHISSIVLRDIDEICKKYGDFDYSLSCYDNLALCIYLN